MFTKVNCHAAGCQGIRFKISQRAVGNEIRRKKQGALFKCLILFLFILSATACHAEVKPDSSNVVNDVSELKDLYETIIPVGSYAPSFKLKDLAGRVWDAETFLKKQVTILYFWSAFCPYCKESLPKLNKLNEKYRQKGLKVLAINLDGRDFSNAIISFLTDSKIKLTVPLDELYEQKFFTAGDPYGVNKTPTIFLVDKSGKIIYEAEVDIDYPFLEKLIQENTKNVKQKVMIIVIAFVILILLSIIVFIFFIRPNMIQNKIIDDLKRRTHDEIKNESSSS